MLESNCKTHKKIHKFHCALEGVVYQVSSQCSPVSWLELFALSVRVV